MGVELLLREVLSDARPLPLPPAPPLEALPVKLVEGEREALGEREDDSVAPMLRVLLTVPEPDLLLLGEGVALAQGDTVPLPARGVRVLPSNPPLAEAVPETLKLTVGRRLALPEPVRLLLALEQLLTEALLLAGGLRVPPPLGEAVSLVLPRALGLPFKLEAALALPKRPLLPEGEGLALVLPLTLAARVGPL